jgi:hypothetical protein
MDEETKNKIAGLEQKIDAIQVSVEKTRKYLLWTGIITAAFIILPIIALMFVIPYFLSSYTALLGGLDF